MVKPTNARAPRQSAQLPAPITLSEAERVSVPEAIDRRFKGGLARLTHGVSPAGVFSVYANWFAHLALSPGKQLELVQQASAMAAALSHYAPRAALDPKTPDCVAAAAGDKRFTDEGWAQWPFNVWRQSFLLTQDWWKNATSGIDG